MKRQAMIYLSVFLVIFLLIFLIFNQRSIQTITFFPIDNYTTFEKASTSLSLIESLNNKSLKWKIYSKSNQPAYLRQDVSLLFGNGKLKGVKSKWKDHTDTIHMEEGLSTDKDIKWEAISYHHGELQYSNTNINSVQDMSYEYLYVIPSKDNRLLSFQKPDTNYEYEAQQQIDLIVKQELLVHWKDLAKHYNISLKDYNLIPFTSLYKYNNSPLPNMTTSQTEEVIGKLWEGVYKNYIILAANTKHEQLTGLEPIILIDKNQSHIIVLFELNNKKDMLIQHI